jgi:hypothetical protein
VWYSPGVRSQTGRGAVAWAILAPTLAFAEVASTPPQASGLALRWSDPSSLAATTESEFEAHLSEQLGHPAFDASTTEHALAVAWQGTPDQCRVQLQLLNGTDVEGTRLLESPSGDCRSLVPALLTVAALLIESRPVEPVSEPVRPVPTAPPPPPPKPPVHVPSPPDRPALVMLSLGAVLGSGLAPKVELGPAASVVLTPARHLRVGVMGSIFFPRQYGASPGLSLGHQSAALVACGMPLSGSFGLGVCANAALHRFDSSGISLPHSEDHDNSTWTAGVAVRVEWRLVRHLWWVGSAGADVTTRPLYFFFTRAAGGESILFRQQRIAPMSFLGLTLELP